MKKYRLVWIRSLMLLSIAMLLALLTSWLFSQYKEQKTLLVKDLNTELKDAEDKVTGKLLYNKYIEPAIEEIKISPDSPIIIHKNVIRRNSISISLNTVKSISTSGNDSLKLIEIANELSKVNKDVNTTITWQGDSTPRHSKKVYSNNLNDDIIKNNVKPMLELVLKNVLSDKNFSGEINFTLDTAKIKKAFDNQLKSHGQDVKVVWDSAQYYYNAHPKTSILLQRKFLDASYFVAIGNYSFHLYKTIAPQFLFVLFLLGVTITAFLFTYNTLKEQIKLGIIKNNLISNMSHELKTPISTVKVALEAISNFNPITDNATTRDYLYMASLEMERLEMLVNQSLNTSLLEEGKMILRREPYNVQQLVERTLHAMQVRFKQTNTEVNVTNTAINTQTHIDILQMQGVLVNLLDNSIKYGGSAPVIHINIAEDEKHLILSVTDNGPGIPEEYISKVFDKFFRVPTGDVHNVKGYGLGLSYVKQVVNQHYGSITVENQDRGCVFTIKLPKTV